MLYDAKRDHRREHAEENAEVAWRKEFMRDYGRVIHSASFRRLQGKTQVFPGHESDFFRNRLTHSLEVAQIAEGIADRLNERDPFLTSERLTIDPRLCATAALLHDLGHPPFGHNGERALDAVMKPFGGFEGNAQSLRIVARLEKKIVEDSQSYGLNLTFRTLASILKYDRVIPHKRDKDDDLKKGYYASEAKLVAEVRRAVAGEELADGEFKTIECSLMDLADDIAYSTFDLEDALKARFLTPSDILASVASDGDLIQRVADKVTKELKGKRPEEVTPKDVARELQVIFEPNIGVRITDLIQEPRPSPAERSMAILAAGQAASNELADSSTLRMNLSSDLVKRAINSAKVVPNFSNPALSRVELSDEALVRVEVLKQYVFLATVSSPRVKMQEYRGTIIVTQIFDALKKDNDKRLMPDDVRRRHEAAIGDDKMRVICDFIAGMTDRYAAEFHARLHSDEAVSMFKQV